MLRTRLNALKLLEDVTLNPELFEDVGLKGACAGIRPHWFLHNLDSTVGFRVI